jgi:protocatechuate 3,4-dioxygenase, beta subunit
MSKFISRRRVLQHVASGGLIGTAPFILGMGRSFAEELTITPHMTEGPFYPDKLPLDTDNDLLVINDSITAAVGEITHLTGKILNAQGKPLRNAFVEIWQLDNQGIYLHSGDTRQREKRDTNFQGYGRFLTNAKGEYYFRTIKPVPYPGRTPHIHVAVSRNGKRIYTTQLFIKDHELNQRDGIYNSIRNEQARNSVSIDFIKLPDSKLGELAANFDVVMGITPNEQENEPIHGGIGRREANGGPGGRRPRPN